MLRARLFRPFTIISCSSTFILLTIIISTIFFRYFPDLFSDPPFRRDFGRSVRIPPLSSTALAFASVNETSRAFRTYFSNCKTHDVYLAGGSCFDNWGIRATLFESLETLLLLNLRSEFAEARQEIAGISLRDFGWVNRHEFWTRVIGSLIGTFLLTRDRLFIEKAIEFAEPLLGFFQIPFPVFVNLGDPDLATKSPGIGTALADCAVGLPEMAALAELTGDSKYVEAIRVMTENLPRPVANSYRDFYHAQKLSAGIDEHVNGHRIPFFTNIGLTKILTGREEYASILQTLSIYSLEEENLSALIPLLLIEPELHNIPYFKVETPDELLDAVEKLYFGTPTFQPTVFLMTSLEQDGLIPLASWKSRQGKDPGGIWTEALLDRLKAIPPGGIPSGTRTTSERRKLPDTILHSEFFALWMKGAALIASSAPETLLTAVFNEAGHFLRF
jgi:hypothetical protein